jgi:hypothetical protein
MDNTGAPLTVALVGIGSVSTQTVNLAPGATEVLEALNGTGVSSEGWVEISLPAGVSGYGVFRQVVPGREDQESLVPFAPESSLNSDFTYDETAFNTAVAFVNPTNQTLTLTATAFGKSGAQVGTTQIVLGPRSKSTNTLKTYSGMAGMVGQRGRVVLSVPTGAVSGLALRFGGSEFTNIPVNHH